MTLHIQKLKIAGIIPIAILAIGGIVGTMLQSKTKLSKGSLEGTPATDPPLPVTPAVPPVEPTPPTTPPPPPAPPAEPTPPATPPPPATPAAAPPAAPERPPAAATAFSCSISGNSVIAVVNGNPINKTARRCVGRNIVEIQCGETNVVPRVNRCATDTQCQLDAQGSPFCQPLQQVEFPEFSKSDCGVIEG